MKKIKNDIQNILFTRSNEEQIKAVQIQINTFRDYITPVYNLKMLQFQLKTALLMNIYLTYLFIVEKNNLKNNFIASSVGALWFTIICVQNIVILLPKIAMMIMLQIVVKQTRSIDELIINIEQFMKTKVYYYNCYFSKFIWLNYGVGIGYWIISMIVGYKENAEKIVTLCHHVLYLMIARLLIFYIKVYFTPKGLSKRELETLIQSKKLVVDEKFKNKFEDCCSICLEDYKENDQYICLDCNHCYHMKCIKSWLVQQNKCPCCNQFAFREL